ncbi:MAG: hypothetical protein FD128_1620, partial [Hyphomonadaceae bacterium]
DKQANDASKNGLQEKWSEIYYSLLRKYDEFNYFDRNSFQINLDSKENFDINFKGSWFNYYR